ncbi:MAG: cell division protein FtsQ/DivIB [Chloroherpetonaceae bacterium]|nr:cell division protein FtsQ/DivIB [Chthonomonadaceae bacterium]MDW8208445.1 cell division protein FtsQ/DivIB [Chloroherpetonaceae bacterium]
MPDYPYPPRWSDHARRKWDHILEEPLHTRRFRQGTLARQQRAIRRARRLVLLVLCLVLVMECIVAVFTSPWFRVRQVTWRATGLLLEHEATAVEEVLRFRSPASWFLVSLGDRTRALHALPFVRSARMQRGVPFSIDAQIQVRIPLVIVRAGNRNYEVDADGVPIRQARPARRHLPFIELQRGEELQPGRPLADPVVTSLIQLARSNEPSLWLRIAKIEVDPQDNLCLNMLDGVRIDLGNTEELARKFRLVQMIYEREPGISQRLRAINLSNPDWPACVVRRGVSVAADAGE